MTVSIPGKFMNRLMKIGLPSDQLKKVLSVFLDALSDKPPPKPEPIPEVALPLAGEWPKDFIEQFWNKETGYPPARLVDKGAVVRKLRILRDSGTVSWEMLITAARRYRNATMTSDPKFIKRPINWLEKGCWEDDPAAVVAAGKETRTPTRNGFMEVMQRTYENGARPDFYEDDPGPGAASTPYEDAGSRPRLASQSHRR